MNKLEKIQNVPVDIVEKDLDDSVIAEEQSGEESHKKSFSFFSFWKKFNSSDDSEEASEGEERSEEKPSFMLRFLNKRTTVLAGCVLLIAVAGFLNVKYSNPAKSVPKSVVENVAGDKTVMSGDTQEDVSGETGTQDYFALAVINRERVRDEAIEMLKDVAGSDSTDVSAKNEAYVEMTRMAGEITSEANIESLVKAKGFSECVAVLSGDKANVIVESEGLTINEVAQIKEIVYLECGVLPDNIKIIEKSDV